MPFTIKCDETGNVQKEDVLTRYCSPEMDQVCVRFLKSLMFGHAQSKKVGQAVLDRPTLQEEGYQLPLKQNKTVWHCVNQLFTECRLTDTVSFIPCHSSLVAYIWFIMPFERTL